MVMKSRFCWSFSPHQPEAVLLNPSQSQRHPPNQRNLNFSLAIWQPFLDVDQESSNRSLICGPLLIMLAEIASSMQANLTYVTESATEAELVKQGQVHILLRPMLPYAKASLPSFYQMSSQLGELPLLSILSAKNRLSESLSLHSLAMFDRWFIRIYLLSFVLLNLLCLVISRNEYLDHRFGFKFFRIVLRQPIPVRWFNSHSKLSLIALNFLLMTLFINQFFTSIFLDLFTSGPAIDQIDSLEDLVNRPNVKLLLFENDITNQLVQNLSRQAEYQNFQGRLVLHRIVSSSYRKFEQWAMGEIADDRMAIISEKRYLNFLYNRYRPMARFRTLHRSATSSFVVPYSLAFRSNQSDPYDKLLKLKANSLIFQMVESGIFNFWMDETVLMNRPPIEQQNLQLSLVYRPEPFSIAQPISQSAESLHFGDLRIIFNLYLMANLFNVSVFVAEVTHQTIRCLLAKIKSCKWISSLARKR